MIYSELPSESPTAYRTIKKKYTSVITPDKFLGNEKLMLRLMLTGVAMVLITWALRE
jgi:hypothetical protein